MERPGDDLDSRFSAGHFAALFSGHPLPMWIHERDTLCFLEVNDAAVALYGYSRDEFRGMRLTDICPDADVARLLSSAGWSRAAVQHSESRHKLRDGRLVGVEIASGTLDFRGRLATLMVVHDVTRRKDAEAELTRLHDEMQFQRLRVFKATMRTVQGIVNDLLNSLQLVHVEAESELPAGMPAVVDRIIREASMKLKRLGDLDTVKEKDMVMGPGIEYPGSES